MMTSISWGRAFGVLEVGNSIHTLGQQDPHATAKTDGPTLMAYGLLMVQIPSSTFGQTVEEALAMDNVRVHFSPYVLPMVFIMSMIGVVTSFFLKNLDSACKAIASALELVFLPLLSAVLFGQSLTLYTVAAVCFVGFGVYIYSLPVETTGTGGLPVYTKVASGEGVEEKDDVDAVSTLVGLGLSAVAVL
ncbi:hypothetical protein BBI17_009212 [Phytophthora kernoviae]|uniref:Uncharacterized protein n=1 Tax=Phytophthora kernoviae TaxID=325452 RepID=A0A421EUZ8_9STRA|nr:hypothetical protein BBI17_009212 [Phytophthora kernoviae]